MSCKIKFSKNNLEREIYKYLENMLIKQIINKILNKYRATDDMYFNYYPKCLNINDKEYADLKYVYHNIDIYIYINILIVD